MSSFMCEKCRVVISDSPNGYVTGCEHYPKETPAQWLERSRKEIAVADSKSQYKRMKAMGADVVAPIKGTDEAWENRELGNDERYVEVAGKVPFVAATPKPFQYVSPQDHIAALERELAEANSMEGRTCWVDGCENLAQRCDAHSFGEGAENAAKYALETMRLERELAATQARLTNCDEMLQREWREHQETKAENLEQARLLGISGSREAKLLAELVELSHCRQEAERAEMLEKTCARLMVEIQDVIREKEAYKNMIDEYIAGLFTNDLKRSSAATKRMTDSVMGEPK